LAVFPKVLQQMDQNLPWTTSLGNAFLAQQEQVMARHPADEAEGLQRRQFQIKLAAKGRNPNGGGPERDHGPGR
jgi:hypothetical protein